MPCSLGFTDGIGAATLTTIVPAPGRRFSAWLPKTMPIGQSVVALGTGATSMFVFRTDYGASFELRRISSKDTASVAPVDIAVRLIAHLLQGGTVSVTTGDLDSNVYATCGLWPGSTPELSLADPKLMEYTLSLQLLNLAGSPSAMFCRYAPNG